MNKRIRKKRLKRKAQALMTGPQGAEIQAGICDMAEACRGYFGADWVSIQARDQYGQVIAGCRV